MAKGFKHGTSGKKPENPLNFAVVAYPSEVELNTATPEDTTIITIGVATTNPITGWYFSSEQPEDMAEGEVWIVTGTTSPVEFNALKKNNLMLYPLNAKQMVSGTLKEVVAKSYLDDEWTDWWNGYLFDNGIIPSFVTEWKSNEDGSNLTLTVGNTIKAMAKGYGILYFYPFPAIDITPFSKFVVDVQIDHASESSYPNVICISKEGTNVTEAVKHISGTSRTTYELDISSFEGVYYCGVLIESWKGADTNATVYSMKLV